MKPVKPFQAVIFDMDNTLLQSRIDFFQMKKVIFELLHHEQLLPSDFSWMDKTPSQIIELGRKQKRFTSIEAEVWKQVGKVEAEGMEGAALEPHAYALLHRLKTKNKRLTVLTNNAHSAILQSVS